MKQLLLWLIPCLLFAAAPVKYGTSTHYQSIQVKAANVLIADTKVPLVLSKSGIGAVIAGCSDSAGLDIVLTTAAGAAVPCTLVAFSKADSTFQMYLQDPAQSTLTGGTQLYLQYGGAAGGQNGSSIWQNVHGSTDDYFLVISGDTAGGKSVDVSKNYVAKDTGVLYDSVGKIRDALSYNGSNAFINWGTVTQLDSVASFTFSVWLTQRVLGTADYLLRKVNTGGFTLFLMTTAPNLIRITIDGTNSYSQFVYTGNVTVNVYFNLRIVYNGAGATNDDRMKIYLNDTLKTLSHVGTIPAKTYRNTVLYTGFTSSSWDGKVDELMLYSGVLDSNQLKLQYANQNGFSTNAVFDIGAMSTFIPVIDSISPLSGKSEDTLTFYVTDLPDSSSSIFVKLNAIEQIILQWSSGTVKILPSGVPRGNYTAPNLGDTNGADTSNTAFYFLESPHLRQPIRGTHRGMGTF